MAKVDRLTGDILQPGDPGYVNNFDSDRHYGTSDVVGISNRQRQILKDVQNRTDLTPGEQYSLLMSQVDNLGTDRLRSKWHSQPPGPGSRNKVQGQKPESDPHSAEISHDCSSVTYRGLPASAYDANSSKYYIEGKGWVPAQKCQG